MKRLRQTVLAILIGSFTASSSSSAIALDNLPDLGAPDLVEYDRKTEERLGRAFTESLMTQFDLQEDPETLNYIRQIGYKIAGNSGQNRNFDFYVIRNNTINAFAGPNGVIGVHTGLIETVHSESELASVIAHEIAHVTQQHLSRTYEYNSTQGSITSFATLLAAVLVGIYNPNAGMAALMGGMGMNMQDQLKNSRQHEQEADNVGIQILHESGYDPHAMGDFFGRLAKSGQFNTHQVPEILRTHPVTLSRLAAAENRAQIMPPLKAAAESNDLILIKMRIAAEKEDFSKLETKGLTPAEQCYLRNLQELNRKQTEKQLLRSRTQLDCLLKQANENTMQPLYSTLLIERIKQFKERKSHSDLTQPISEALKLISYQQELWPNNLAVQLRHAQLLELTGEYQKAMQVLANGSENGHNQYQINNYLAQFAREQNKEALANYYQARAQISVGNYARARHFIDEAKRINNQRNEGIDKQIDFFNAKYTQNLQENDQKESVQ
ncbi:M48 family metalloprotease [Thiomicrorhabdus sp. 6S3-12]|uniref:M48 family metalloprotease n=1 Tax=Thiomicrorhabdus sp. 6S3-12 TaxID=2819681 RepID=UPI001AAC49B3|nr:M48 family metalloprotease [Thiomicrorhabdus sp. 6S3-12]MBO1923613.1 M48 family metalloprotease [Thiomicrorhabdus sp. 6S3-12]